ncbi:MAG TPA: hypothetical protein PKM43_15780 [Verrucomicrobiota bacterium]|nr:hypothetical protein [Verrucomicrobiota bacterium]HRZ39183.1 hypothetical protein [Candidatus Paceibacterota bacterium]HRZ57808.1 hypothetical protein [Candidatus Paceibacterota bacterium]
MNSKLNRRRFIARAPLAAATVAVARPSLSASASGPAAASTSRLPTGRIGKLTVSRLISGGNLISGWAHARDLHYVASLMRAYNTDDKVLDTLEKLEQHGVNTIISDPRKKPMDIFARYWKERGGKMQWIAEGHPGVDDWKTNIRQSIDFGAAAVYVQGVIGDRWLKEGRIELLGQCVEFIKGCGVPGGIGAHKLGVIVEAETQKFGAEFYVKTLHHGQYWSTRRPDQSLDVIDNPADNYWEMDADQTVRFMQGVEKPWIAFKVLAAGAIRPESGFKFALENGADFLCVGMFDFQVEANTQLMNTLLASNEIQNRARAWMA